MKYNPSFIAFKPILSNQDKQELYQLSNQYPLSKFLSDARNYEEVAIDFVYTSAKIEGNTYSRLDTDNLLRLGITAGGKRYSDAKMLLNLREGFQHVMLQEKVELDIDYVSELHKILMKDLLPLHEQGLVRNGGVKIGGSSYEPIADPWKLRTEMKFIFEESKKYTDPFEKSIYLHCNLAYLQYFRDGNKRTSRMMQTSALVQGGVLPLFFSDTLINAYVQATVTYYETGDYTEYVRFFKSNYQESIQSLKHEQNFQPQEKQEFDRRIKDLIILQNKKDLSEDDEALKECFLKIIKQETQEESQWENLNWTEIERLTMVDGMGVQGIHQEKLADFLCQVSPGACSSEKQQWIREDIQKLAPVMQIEFEKSKKEIAKIKPMSRQ